MHGHCIRPRGSLLAFAFLRLFYVMVPLFSFLPECLTLLWSQIFEYLGGNLIGSLISVLPLFLKKSKKDVCMIQI